MSDEEVDCIQVKVLKDQVNDDFSDFFKRKHLDTIQNMPISLIDFHLKKLTISKLAKVLFVQFDTIKIFTKLYVRS